MSDKTVTNMLNRNDNGDPLIERFKTKIEKEKSLAFLDSFFKELPELEMYLVGGLVRDTILKHKTPKDYDFIARGVPIAKLIKTLKKYGAVDLVGRDFGVIKFLPTDSNLTEPIDIALPRTEIAFNTGGYRDFEAQADHNLPIEDDLSRRDYTINAIAYDLKNGKIIDPFDGQKDLKNKTIRAVGNPEQRILENYSRMLRALRFACKLDFKIEDKTWNAIKKFMPAINDEREVNIVQSLKRKIMMESKPDKAAKLKLQLEAQIKKDPAETKMERIEPYSSINKETLKAFAENPARALELFEKSGALEMIMPEVLTLKNCPQPPEFHTEGDVWQHTAMMLEKIDSKEFKVQFPKAKITGEFVLGALLHDIGKPPTLKTPEKDGTNRIRFDGHNTIGAEIAAKIGRRLELPKETIEKWKFMVSEHMFPMTLENIDKVGHNAIAKRFIDSAHSQDLLMLFYLDSVCTVPKSGGPNMKKFQDMLVRIQEIKTIRANQPEKILDGKDVIALLNVNAKTEGAFVGLIMQLATELKDKGKLNTEKEALAFLKKQKDFLTEYKEKILTQGKTDFHKLREALVDEIVKKI
ncbi:MAG: HD domain-containing protein [Parcubacteria group bacterium]